MPAAHDHARGARRGHRRARPRARGGRLVPVDDVARLAEDAGFYVPVVPGSERIANERWSLVLGHLAHINYVHRLRLGPAEVEETVEEIRALLRERGRARAVWWIGPSSTPPDLVERLEALGLRTAGPPEEPRFEAMVLTGQPPPGNPLIETRTVESLDDFEAAIRIQEETFGLSTDDGDRLAERFANRDADALPIFLAFLDGEPIASASAFATELGLMLMGGATRPEARGRGAYRSLVRARWDEAVRRGTPALAVQGGELSRPILERLGFRSVGALRLLEDVLE